MAQDQIPHFTDVESEENTMAAEEARVEQDILREFEADGSSAEWLVKIKKVNEKTKKQDDCFEITPDELKSVSDRLEDEYGPGEYRLYVKRDGVLKHNLRLGIARRRTPPQPTGDGSGALVPQIAHMMERQTELIASIATGAGPVATPAPDQNAMMTSMLDMMIKMKEFTAPAGGGAGGKFEDFIRIWEFSKEMGGERSGESSTADIFREFLKSPVAGELAESMREQRYLAAQRRGALPPPARESAPVAPLPAGTPAVMRPAAPPPVQESAPEGVTNPVTHSASDPLGVLDQPMQARLKNDVDFWVTRAQAGSHPGIYAEVVVDVYPVEIIQSVLLRDDLKELATALNPIVADNWEWFAELVEEVKHLLTQAAAEVHESSHVPEQEKRPTPPIADGNTGRPGGGGGDAIDHAGIDAAGEVAPVDPGQSD